MERVARPVDLEAIRSLPPVDYMVTGTGAINMEGVRFGKGHGFFDAEWGMLYQLGRVTTATPTAAVVHDCQVLDEKLTPPSSTPSPTSSSHPPAPLRFPAPTSRPSASSGTCSTPHVRNHPAAATAQGDGAVENDRNRQRSQTGKKSFLKRSGEREGLSANYRRNPRFPGLSGRQGRWLKQLLVLWLVHLQHARPGTTPSDFLPFTSMDHRNRDRRGAITDTPASLPKPLPLPDCASPNLLEPVAPDTASPTMSPVQANGKPCDEVTPILHHVTTIQTSGSSLLSCGSAFPRPQDSPELWVAKPWSNRK